MKKRFSTFYIANKPFWTTKTSVSKTHKIGIFAKGLVHGFGQKFEILWTFRWCKIHPEKVLGDVLVRKQAFLEYENISLKKTPNLHFSKGFSPWFWSKSWSFIIFSVYQKQIEKKCLVTFWIKTIFLEKIDQENLSGDVLVRKTFFYHPLYPPVTPSSPL